MLQGLQKRGGCPTQEGKFHLRVAQFSLRRCTTSEIWKNAMGGHGHIYAFKL